MTQKSYPIGSPEDFIINVLPPIAEELLRFLDVTQKFLRDFQLDLELIAAGTSDTKQMADDLQSRVRELQREVIVSVEATKMLQGMINEMKYRL
jgi:hypothetical protein